jgi:hypothetical protein
MRAYDSTDLAGAAHLARQADAPYDDRPHPSEYMDDPPWCDECGAEIDEGSATNGYCWSCGERV